MIAIEADAAFNLVLFLETDRAYLLCVFHNESTGGYARCIAPTGGAFPIVAEITETSPNAATALDAEVYLVPGGEWMLTVYAQDSSTDLDETSATARELIYTSQVQVDRDSDEELVATPPGGGGVGTEPDADGCRYIRVCGTPTDGQVVTWNEDEGKYEPATPASGPGGGVSDHGALTGLADDDHTQYHNNTRGDARYYTQGQVDTALGGKANTSHTHAISDTTGLQTALDGKQAAGSYAAASHSHVIADVTGLQTAIDGKAAADHSHDIDDVTGLQTALDAKASTTSLSTLINEDPGAGVGIIESGAGVAPYVLKNIKDGNGTTVTNNTGSLQIDIGNGAISNAMLANGAVANLSGTNTGDQDLSSYATGAAVAAAYLSKSNNLSDIANAATARANLNVIHAHRDTVGSGQTTTSTTLANITGLSLDVDANEHVSIHVRVLFEVSSASGGIGLGINGSTAAAYFAGRFEAVQGAGNFVQQITAYNATTNATTCPVLNTVYYAEIHAELVNGASASTITPMVARGGSGTLTIRAASIEITRS